jgi:hypothetical protein
MKAQVKVREGFKGVVSVFFLASVDVLVAFYTKVRII